MVLQSAVYLCPAIFAKTGTQGQTLACRQAQVHPPTFTHAIVRRTAAVYAVGGTSPEIWHEMLFEPQIP